MEVIGLAASVVGFLAKVSGASGRLRRDQPSTSFGIEVLDGGFENPVAEYGVRSLLSTTLVLISM
jgi:ABC-type Co2+ transport system permease subunit